jgi:multimeric flavodoxin WrbA
MRLTVFNGSARGKKGNTKIILDHFLRGFEATSGNTIELYYLNRLKGTDQFVQAFADAETVLIAHPLYTDAMPGIVKAFIEALEPLVSRESKPAIGILVQSGFQEAAHSRPVERYWEKLTKRLGSRYLGTIVRGGCLPIHRKEEQFQKLLDGFNEIGKVFGETGEFDQEMIRKFAGPEKLPGLMRFIVKLVWKISGNSFFDDWLKENNVLEESFAKPYVE